MRWCRALVLQIFSWDFRRLIDNIFTSATITSETLTQRAEMNKNASRALEQCQAQAVCLSAAHEVMNGTSLCDRTHRCCSCRSQACCYWHCPLCFGPSVAEPRIAIIIGLFLGHSTPGNSSVRNTIFCSWVRLPRIILTSVFNIGAIYSRLSCHFNVWLYSHAAYQNAFLPYELRVIVAAPARSSSTRLVFRAIQTLLPFRCSSVSSAGKLWLVALRQFQNLCPIANCEM